MGVSYKITKDILDYIIKRKEAETKLSCQDISDELMAKFSLKVSKSSIHEALKAAGVIKPQTRKIKDTFALPNIAKEKIQQDLLKMGSAILPANPIPPMDNDLALIPDVVKVDSKVAEEQQVVLDKKEEPFPDLPLESPALPKLEGAKQRLNYLDHAGEIILGAILWEMGLAAKADFKAALNDPYHNYLAYAYKVVFDGGKTFFIDVQFSDISIDFNSLKKNPRLLPRANMEGCDRLFNCNKPLIINDLDSNSLADSFKELWVSGLRLASLSILNRLGEDIVLYPQGFPLQRQINNRLNGQICPFIKIEGRNDVNTLESMAYIIFGQDFTQDEFIQIINMEGFITKSHAGNTLNLIFPQNFSKTASLALLCGQISSLNLEWEAYQELSLKAISIKQA